MCPAHLTQIGYVQKTWEEMRIEMANKLRDTKSGKAFIKKMAAIIMVITLLPLSDIAGIVSIGNDTEVYGEAADVESIPDHWVVTEDYRLTKDVQVSELNIQSGNLDLNGHTLEVSGNVTVAGKLTFGYGSLYCGGDFILEDNADCYMRNEHDYLEIHGDFIDKLYDRSNTIYFIYGTMKVYGDLLAGYGITFEKGVQIEFCGEEKQSVYVRGFSGDAVIQCNNFSEEGILAVNTEHYTWKIAEGCKVTDTELQNVKMEDRTLEEDEAIFGDLAMEDGVLDLNGHTLTVYGDVRLYGGTLHINHGKLIVKGELITGYQSYVEDKSVIYSG